MEKRLCMALGIALASSGFAADLLSWTYPGPIAPPSWIQQAAPPASGQTLAELSFDLTPPSAGLELLVTVTFNETNDGFLRVIWTQNGQAATLSGNFQEGTGMANRRAILVPEELLRGPGRITFQSGTADLKVTSIEWDWLQPRLLSIAPGKGEAWRAVDAMGTGRTAAEISGDPEVPGPDQWQNSVITAPITDAPARIEDPVQFSVPLAQAPSVARLEVLLAGLPLNLSLRVWINGKDGGLLSVAVPDLTDAGYQHDAAGAVTYVGWRPASAWLDPGLFSAGQNVIQFEPLWQGQSPVPLAVKQLRLQLDYGAPVSTPSPAPAAPPVSPETSPAPAAASSPAPEPAAPPPATGA